METGKHTVLCLRQKQIEEPHTSTRLSEVADAFKIPEEKRVSEETEDGHTCL